MPVSPALRRLLRIVDIQEEQCRLALEAAVAELARLEHWLAASEDRARSGRRLVVAGVRSSELPDRLAGLEETRSAVRWTEALLPQISEAEVEVAHLREDFLTKRVERRQAETLIEEAEARDALEASRHSQQSLDDWYLNRLHASRVGIQTERCPNPAPQSSSPCPVDEET